jgi:hypothetical protein
LENRMIVACSRARHGFVVLGNDELLRQAKHWAAVLDTMSGRITQAPTLHCGRHPASKVTVTVDDAVRLGGSTPDFCTEPCGTVLCKKGHTCTRPCHSDPHSVHTMGSNCPQCKAESIIN